MARHTISDGRSTNLHNFTPFLLLISFLSAVVPICADELKLELRKLDSWKDHSDEIEAIKADTQPDDEEGNSTSTSRYFSDAGGWGMLINEFRYPKKRILQPASHFLIGEIGKPLHFELTYKNTSGKPVTLETVSLVVDDFFYFTGPRGSGSLELEGLSLERTPEFVYLEWPSGHLELEQEEHSGRSTPLMDRPGFTRTTATLSEPITLAPGEEQVIHVQTHTKPYLKHYIWGSSHVLFHLEMGKAGEATATRTEGIFLIGDQWWLINDDEDE